MHHEKSLALAFALATLTLSAAPAEAMSIPPPAELAFVAQVPRLLSSAITAPGSAPPLSAFDGRDEHSGRVGYGTDGSDHGRRDGKPDRDSRSGGGDDDDGQGGDGSGYRGHDGDGDAHHHPGGGWDGGGTPQTVPLPTALPLLLSGLASLLTVARRRKP